LTVRLSRESMQTQQLESVIDAAFLFLACFAQ